MAEKRFLPATVITNDDDRDDETVLADANVALEKGGSDTRLQKLSPDQFIVVEDGEKGWTCPVCDAVIADEHTASRHQKNGCNGPDAAPEETT